MLHQGGGQGTTAPFRGRERHDHRNKDVGLSRTKLLRRLIQGPHHHLLHLGVGDSARHPGAGSSPSPSSRRARNRARHLVTVPRLTRSRAATAVLLRPSAQASTICARSASPWAVLRRLDQVLQRPALVLRKHQRLQPRITHATSRPQAKATVTTRAGT